MGEKYWDSLKAFIDSDIKKKDTETRRNQNQIEKVRKILEAKASEVIAAYEQKCQELAPVAQDKLTQVVVPWWNEEIINTGLGTYLARWMSRRVEERLIITEPYSVFWPNGLYREMSDVGKPFAYTAGYIAEWTSRTSTLGLGQKRLREELERMEASEKPADFQLRRHDSAVGLEFYFGRGFRGCGFRSENYSVPIQIAGARTRIPKINPSVIIDFAGQIENGQVRSVIEQSIRGKRL